jgi:DNA-binding NarL/FixJ family response regulator
MPAGMPHDNDDAAALELIGAAYEMERAEPEWLRRVAQLVADWLGSPLGAFVALQHRGGPVFYCSSSFEPARARDLYVVSASDPAGGSVDLGVPLLGKASPSARRDAFLERVVTHLAAANGLRRRLGAPRSDVLSEREVEVLEHAVRGSTNKEIAFDLGLAASTVRVLLHRAAHKLGARGRAEAIRRFQEPRRAA